MSMRGYFRMIVMTLLLGVMPRMCWAEEIVEFAVLAFRGVEKTLVLWQPTLRYLESQIPETRFRLLPLSLEEMETAVARDEVDIVLTNPGQYAVLESEYGITRLLTLRNRRLDHPLSHFGAVIFTRADREDIHTLDDLKNRSMAAVSWEAFGGFQMAWYEMAQAGIDPFREMDMRFSGFPQDDVVRAVRKGAVDAGTVRTDVLERMALAGTIDLADFKILQPQPTTTFPFVRSTRLYPEWAIARTKQTDEVLAAKIMLALLQMPEDAPALAAGNYAGWDSPGDYSSVHQLLKALEVRPYTMDGARRLAQLFRDYQTFMWAFIGFWLVLLVVVSIKLKHSNRRLSHALSEWKGAGAVLQERTHALERFAYVAAHDLREPLRTVRSFIGFIEEELDEAVSPGVSDYIFRIRRATTRMNGLIDDLLRYSRAINVSSVPSPLSLTEVFKNVTEDLQALVRETSAKLVWQKQEWPIVLADAGQMHQLFQNLLTNALKYGQTGIHPVVLLTAHRVGDRLEIRVKDNGMGFDVKNLSRMLEPFERLSNSRDISGAGVGLAICQRIVEMHGGILTAESSPGEGACFILSLPLLLDDAE